MGNNESITGIFMESLFNCFFFFTETTDGITATIGFSNSSFSLHRFHVSLFDVGGGARIRAIWKNYYAEVRNYENCS